MRVIPPLEITDARLTSSSAPETAPAAYAGGTTYALDATASTGTRGGVITVWKSLQAANTGNTPSSSPTWWANIGTTYSVWDASAWATGDKCIVISTDSHRTYEALQATTNNIPASSPTFWLDLSTIASSRATNRWNMFDTLRSTQTTFVSPGIIVLTPGKRINSIGLSGLEATSVNITVTSVLGGGTVYNYTKLLPLRVVAGCYDYLFMPFDTYTKSMVVFDIPPYTDCIITITITNTQGVAKCGSCVIGNYVYVGAAQCDATADGLNFSSVTRDTFGNATMNAGRNVPQTNQVVMVNASLLSKILSVRDQLNGTTAFWTALDTDDGGYFGTFMINGFTRKFSVVAKTAEKATIQIELEEV